jgi:hypothetical protein
MRVVLVALYLGIFTTIATAQPKEEANKPGDSPWSTGRTVLLDNKGQLPPQGWTGPISTEPTGGRRCWLHGRRRASLWAFGRGARRSVECKCKKQTGR